MPFQSGDSLVVVIKNAVDLEAADLNGKSDPYVIIQTKPADDNIVLSDYMKDVMKRTKVKTSIKKKTLNPTWNETKTFYSISGLDQGKGIKLSFKVFDWDMLSRDDAIGKADLILNYDEHEFGKEYPTSLKLTNCKSGSLNISYKIINYNQETLVNNYKYHKALFTPYVAVICAPKEFSLLSASSVGSAHCAMFADTKTGEVLISTYVKLENANVTDYDKIAKTMSDERLCEMRKSYSKVEIHSTRSNIKVDPYCKNKLINYNMEYELKIEKGATRLMGTMRFVGHSNGYLAIYVFVEPFTYSAIGSVKIDRISEGTDW